MVWTRAVTSERSRVFSRPQHHAATVDGVISVAELVTPVDVALGTKSVADYESFDANHDGHVSSNELVQAVSAALQSCPSI